MTELLHDHAVVDDPDDLRYEIFVNGQLAGHIAYRVEPGVLVLVYTDVELRWANTWVGLRLVELTLDDIRARGLQAAPLCPFIHSFVRKRPEYADLIVRDPAVSD
jgi:predicted GNAT family acetyltransferase